MFLFWGGGRRNHRSRVYNLGFGFKCHQLASQNSVSCLPEHWSQVTKHTNSWRLPTRLLDAGCVSIRSIKGLEDKNGLKVEENRTRIGQHKTLLNPSLMFGWTRTNQIAHSRPHSSLNWANMAGLILFWKSCNSVKSLFEYFRYLGQVHKGKTRGNT